MHGPLEIVFRGPSWEAIALCSALEDVGIASLTQPCRLDTAHEILVATSDAERARAIVRLFEVRERRVDRPLPDRLASETCWSATNPFFAPWGVVTGLLYLRSIARSGHRARHHRWALVGLAASIVQTGVLAALVVWFVRRDR